MNTSLASSNNGDQSNEIPSLLVPMKEIKLVLPTVSVAEMIPYQAPQARQQVVYSSVPDWYLGSLYWRGVSVPMLSFEGLNGDPLANIVADSQLLILNNTGVSDELPFTCLPTQGIPRLSRVAVNEISENTQVSLKQYESMRVHVAGEQALIPDITKLELACATMLGLRTA